MNDYNFYADLLNKYSQLTPWVQAVIGFGICGATLGLAFFLKESIVAIMKPLYRTNAATSAASAPEEKREWRDKYYRDGTE
ncbi:MAG: hypothetical protein H6908_02275 [Hyphomicrobiales bacterium]|nr:hypothetical protein [Hyphomicrobiales bacterium]